MVHERRIAESLNPVPLRQQERVLLRGRRASSYIDMLLSLLRAGRLNQSFPDRDRLINLYRMLAPKYNYNMFSAVEIGSRSGLPTERAITSISSERDLAPEVVAREEKRDPRLRDFDERRADKTSDKYLRNYLFHRDLLRACTQPAFALDLKLRWTDPERNSASFITILDRFELGTEMFCRYTICLRHVDSPWSLSQVAFENDESSYKENFRNLIARAATRDAEIAFILLAGIENIEVESVCRTCVGPLSFAGTSGPAQIQELVEGHPGEFILSLATQRADVALQRDFNADPCADTFQNALEPAALELVHERQHELGYHVRQERKFVCTSGIAALLGKFLKQAGKPCVVYRI